MPSKKESVLKNYKERKAMIDLRNKVIKHHNMMNALLTLNNNMSDDLLRAIRQEALAIVVICDDTVNWDSDTEGAVKDE
jgi:hypothetical protein